MTMYGLYRRVQIPVVSRVVECVASLPLLTLSMDFAGVLRTKFYEAIQRRIHVQEHCPCL